MQFLSIAKGSAGEARSMLYAALDVGYIDEAEFGDMLVKAEELGKSIGSFRAGLDRSTPRPQAGK